MASGGKSVPDGAGKFAGNEHAHRGQVKILARGARKPRSHANCSTVSWKTLSVLKKKWRLDCPPDNDSHSHPTPPHWVKTGLRPGQDRINI